MRQSGNALIFILLAVFLLGALAALMMRSGGQTEETGETEKISIEVSKLIRYTTSIQTAVEQMRLRGISENQISFANTVYQQCDGTPLQGPGHNSKCARPECEIFDVRGGALTPMALPQAILTDASCAWWKPGAVALNLKRVEGIGDNTRDELMIEVGGLNKQACLQINRQIGISSVGGDAPVDDVSGGSTFSGTFSTYGPQIGNEYTGFIGKKAFCLKSNVGATEYSFFTVLIAK